MRPEATARTVAGVVVLLISSSACAQVDSRSVSAITAPSAAPGHTLVVRVHERGSEAPLAGALVRHNTDGHYTDASGEAHLVVTLGEETTIDVSAPEYHSMQATGTLNGDERWTFYLEPSTNQ